MHYYNINFDSPFTLPFIFYSIWNGTMHFHLISECIYFLCIIISGYIFMWQLSVSICNIKISLLHVKKKYCKQNVFASVCIKCLYPLTDITEIGVWRNHTCLFVTDPDSVKNGQERDSCFLSSQNTSQSESLSAHSGLLTSGGLKWLRRAEIWKEGVWLNLTKLLKSHLWVNRRTNWKLNLSIFICIMRVMTWQLRI